MSGGAICGGTDVLMRTIEECPTEGKRRRMLGEYAAWYGWTLTCLGCGDRWMDGERGERPFERGWRQKSIAYAERRYAHALSGAAVRSATQRVMREAVA